MPARSGTARSYPENVPPGTIFSFAGGSAPTGYLICDGSTYNISAYPDLFNAISNHWGGDGVTTFAVPDPRGRVAVHAGSAGGLTARTLGDTFGEETHTLNISELAAHTHPDAGHSHNDTGHGHSVNDPGHFHNMPTTGLSLTSGGNRTPNNVNNVGPAVPTINATTGISLNSGSAAIQVSYAATQNNGGNSPHNNLQPSIVFYAIIKF